MNFHLKEIKSSSLCTISLVLLPSWRCIYDNAELDGLKIISDIWHKRKHVTYEKTSSLKNIFFLFFFFKLLKYKSQQRSMQIMCHMQVHCIYMCFLPLPAYFDPFISFYRCFVILQYWFWRVGVFFFFCSCSFIHPSYKSSAVKLWLTATALLEPARQWLLKPRKYNKTNLKYTWRTKKKVE